MTREVTIGEIMSNPVSIITEVERGVTAVVTRHGEAIAVILPVPADVKIRTVPNDVVDAEIVDTEESEIGFHRRRAAEEAARVRARGPITGDIADLGTLDDMLRVLHNPAGGTEGDPW